MNTITYKCPNCGGGLVFAPKTQKFQCEYCLSEFMEEELEAMAAGSGLSEKEAATEQEPDLPQKSENSAGAGAETKAGAEVKADAEVEAGAEAEAGAEVKAGAEAGANAGVKANAEAEAGREEAMAVYSCPSCGAQLMAEETTAATYCYYCHNPVILSGRLSGGYRPDCVVPFEMDQKKAREIFKSWISRKKYIPRDFYSPEQMELLEGIYYPYWLFNCRVEGTIRARGIKRKVSRLGSVENIETSSFKVEREGAMDVRNIARNALKKADRRLSEAVLPFDMEKIRPFEAGYLSGFRAERRDVESEEFRADVETEVKSYAQDMLVNSISAGYDSVSVEEHEEELRDKTWIYALLPVWVLTYRGKKDGKIYYFAMNGQSGKLCGVLPVDYGRLAVLFASIFFPLFLLFLLGGYLL